MGNTLASVEEFLIDKGRHLVIVVGIFAMVLILRDASAFNQPAMNLGFTSFADGGAQPEGYAGPAVLLAEDVQWYDSSTFRDVNGHKLPGRNRVSLLVNNHQLFLLRKLHD